jgi:hypothetical protein
MEKSVGEYFTEVSCNERAETIRSHGDLQRGEFDEDNVVRDVEALLLPSFAAKKTQ